MAEPPMPSPVTLSRRYPVAPMVGTAAAIFDADGRVLLVQRGRQPRLGTWGLPGGLLDLGERLVEGARREVQEECGIEVEIRDLIAAYEPIIHDAEGRLEYHYVVLEYWGVHRSGAAVAGDDAAAVAWVALSDLAGYKLRPDAEQIIREGHRRWVSERMHARKTTGRP